MTTDSTDAAVDEPSVSPTEAPASFARITTGQWMTLLAAFLGWMFDGLEMGIFPLAGKTALQSLLRVDSDGVITKEEAAVVSTWEGWNHSAFLLGAAGGGLVFGWLGDRFGRVRAMMFSVLTYSLFTGAIYFAETPFQLTTLRFISALGMGGEWSLGVALVMECWP
ncbi:MAG: MFS transporter, partial [Planctomycetia bacterium]